MALDNLQNNFDSQKRELSEEDLNQEDLNQEDLNNDVIEPLPTGETEEELDRIRQSNDLDQQMEREGVVSRHNRGYDDAAHGTGSSKG